MDEYKPRGRGRGRGLQEPPQPSTSSSQSESSSHDQRQSSAHGHSETGLRNPSGSSSSLDHRRSYQSEAGSRHQSGNPSAHDQRRSAAYGQSEAGSRYQPGSSSTHDQRRSAAYGQSEGGSRHQSGNSSEHDQRRSTAYGQSEARPRSQIESSASIRQPQTSNVQTQPQPSSDPSVAGDTGRGGLQVRSRRPYVTFTEADINPGLISTNSRSGNDGRSVNVITNCVNFTKLSMKEVFVYDMNMSETVKARLVPQKYDMIKWLQSTQKLPNCAIAYDGRSIFSDGPLGPADEFAVEICNESRYVDGSGRLAFRKVGTCTPGTEQWLRVISVTLNLIQQLNGQKKYGNSYFVPPSEDIRNAKFNNPNELSFMPCRFRLRDQYELLQGYDVSLQRSLQNGNPLPILIISGTHRLVNTQLALYDIERNPNAARTTFPGRSVLTRHNGKNYIIVDVTQPMSIDTTFSFGTGTKSFRHYFDERYGIQLTKTHQPFLKCKLRRVDRLNQIKIRRAKGLLSEGKEAVPDDIMLPSELCYLTGLADDQKIRLQRDQEFNTLCRKAPEKRAEDVDRYIKFAQCQQKTQALLKDWGIEMNRQPMQINARVLPICFDKRQQFRDNASLNNNTLTVFKPANRQSTTVIIDVYAQCRNLNQDGVARYVEGIKQAAQKMRFQIDVNGRQQGRNLNEAIMNAIKNKVDIILMLIDDSFRYKEIKTTCIEQGVLSQVVRGQTAQKPVTAQKVAMQMACKVGFVPWKLASGLPTGREDYMIVGVDVFTGKGASNVQVAVFSLDRDCGKYYTYVNYVQGRNMECLLNLEAAFKEALVAYRKQSGRFPTRIFLYRDGVSDSQLFNVMESEIKPLMKSLEVIYGSQPFHLIATVVKKRISQRFFVRTNNRIQNVPPGTVVDKDIVKPNWFEYYIVPQEAGQGTATPTNFHVIENNHQKQGDTLYLKPDDLQRTTFALTHLYFNWTGTIRVPAPVQYAHKCAFLLGQCAINSVIHQNIRTNLFYL